jgi:EVE domain
VRFWLGVVSREHVRRGVTLGIAQIGHGRREGLARMSAGDVLVYYSPRASLEGCDPVKAFTATGTIADDTIWQADEGDFKPWRRRVDYVPAVDAPIAPLLPTLDLTSRPNWGYQLRRGLIELSPGDADTIRRAMRVPA